MDPAKIEVIKGWPRPPMSPKYEVFRASRILLKIYRRNFQNSSAIIAVDQERSQVLLGGKSREKFSEIEG